MRGQADWDGPSNVNPEYTPATNALPYLEKLSAELESPLMPIVFNWERDGRGSSLMPIRHSVAKRRCASL